MKTSVNNNIESKNNECVTIAADIREQFFNGKQTPYPQYCKRHPQHAGRMVCVTRHYADFGKPTDNYDVKMLAADKDNSGTGHYYEWQDDVTLEDAAKAVYKFLNTDPTGTDNDALESAQEISDNLESRKRTIASRAKDGKQAWRLYGGYEASDCYELATAGQHPLL